MRDQKVYALCCYRPAEGDVVLQVLYALALVPVGFLADRADRPRLLSGGLAAWSLLTMAASKARHHGTFRLVKWGLPW